MAARDGYGLSAWGEGDVLGGFGKGGIAATIPTVLAFVFCWPRGRQADSMFLGTSVSMFVDVLKDYWYIHVKCHM